MITIPIYMYKSKKLGVPHATSTITQLQCYSSVQSPSYNTASSSSPRLCKLRITGKASACCVKLWGHG